MHLHGKRALVTGADGFIGSHLVEALVASGAKVRALSLYNSFNSWGWIEDLACLSQVEVVTGDIRDPHLCLELTRDVDVIYHLAALIPIPYSYRAPDSFVDTNVKGTLHLCQAALANRVERLIHTSTSEVYGTAQYTPMDEKHPLNAQSPYSATKIGADAIARSFYCSFRLPAVIARPFNTFGPRQSARAVIPNIVAQLAAGRAEVSLGELETTRDFTYVEDTCRGLLAIGQMDGGLGEVFHIGSNREIGIGELFRLIARMMGKPEAKAVREAARLRPEMSEVLRLRCDNRKLEAATGFLPGFSLEQGLRKTVEWFGQEPNLRRYKEHLYNV